jgi:hypothetical protein
MTLPKFLLSGIGTIAILLIGLPIIMTYPALKAEKATGIAVVAGALTEAVLSPQFWLSAILLLLFFWYTSQFSSKILRVVLFWMPTVSATVIGVGIVALIRYAHTHSPWG